MQEGEKPLLPAEFGWRTVNAPPVAGFQSFDGAPFGLMYSQRQQVCSRPQRHYLQRKHCKRLYFVPRTVRLPGSQMCFGCSVGNGAFTPATCDHEL